MDDKLVRSPQNGSYILYSAPHSLYAGRARAYLIKRGISFEERSLGHNGFKRAAALGKLPTIPILVTPLGEVIRDGAAIVEHFESTCGHPCSPSGPLQNLLSILFDVIGAEGLRRPAMHYRWNYPEDNDEFLRQHFFLLFPPDTPDREKKTESAMVKLRSVTKLRGVNEDSRELVEVLYLEFLDALNNHFKLNPYLLGDRPCVGDFGLLAPLYGHLGRDPHPAALMKKRAPRVYRWVERMNRADKDASEYFDRGTDFLPNDEIPDTLQSVLRVVAQDFIPETAASADFLNFWLSQNKPEAGTPAVFRLGASIGSIDFQVRAQAIKALVVPYRHFQLQRIHRAFDESETQVQGRINRLLGACGMADVLNIRLQRQIGRLDNLEVWLD